MNAADRATLMDHMHHALGRPVNPFVDTYRNYYCADAGSEESKLFEASGFMDFLHHINNGRSEIWSVNGAGKQALDEWMQTAAGREAITRHCGRKAKR